MTESGMYYGIMK